MKSLPWSLRLYVALVVGAGASLLVYLTPRIEVPDWWEVVFWALMILLPEFLAVSLPRGGAAITVGFAIEYASVLSLGPALTAWLVVFSSLVVDGFVRRVPAHKLAFNTFQFVLTVGLAGLVFEWTGGVVGSPNFGLFVMPLILCALAYFIVNTTTISIAVGLYERTSAFRSWTANFRWAAINYLSLGVFGLLMTLIYLKIGSWAAGFFLVPLLLARYVFKLYVDMREEHRQTIAALVAAVDTKDGFFAGHSHRVKDYSAAIARELGLSEAQVEMVEYAALLHDLGRVKISEAILLKPGALTATEWQVMKEHPVTAEQIIAPLRFLRGAGKMVRHHHETPDGSGYPNGLRGEEIPWGAHILKVADAYDAMTHDRPYRKALSAAQAVEELKRDRGTKFDSRIVDCIVALVERGEVEP